MKRNILPIICLITMCSWSIINVPVLADMDEEDAKKQYEEEKKQYETTMNKLSLITKISEKARKRLFIEYGHITKISYLLNVCGDTSTADMLRLSKEELSKLFETRVEDELKKELKNLHESGIEYSFSRIEMYETSILPQEILSEFLTGYYFGIDSVFSGLLSGIGDEGKKVFCSEARKQLDGAIQQKNDLLNSIK